MERIVQRVYEGDQEVPEGATEHVRLGVRYQEHLANSQPRGIINV